MKALPLQSMQLCNPDVVKALIESSLPPRIAVEAPKTLRRAMAPRCQCGQCAPCRENARWERIFQEKFADPTYYMRQPVRQRSSLDGIA